MKRAIELVDKEWADGCHESIYPLMEHVAQRAREEMQAACLEAVESYEPTRNVPQTYSMHGALSSVANRIVALPVTP